MHYKEYYFYGLKNVLLVIIYLMLTILPTTHSAPSTMNPPRKVCTAKWLKNCLTEVNFAKSYAENDKVYFTEYHNWVNDTSTPSWLPDIGKKVDENISDDILNDLTAEEALPIIYNNLQTMAAILEDVIRELKDKPLHKYFASIRNHNNPIFDVLKQVMVSMGIEVPHIPLPSDGIIPGDIVEAFRDGDKTKTTAFATIIFRECINNYQYAQQTLTHLLSQLDPDQDGCS